jgi:catechol 2,3-dioxygenase-like lactoylglutathione lyase family enzyme
MTALAKAAFDVGGVQLERPFKIRRLGHVGLSLTRMEEALHFYLDLLGFRISDINDYSSRLPADLLATVGDPNGYFTRYGSDHHALVLGNKKVAEARNPALKERSETRFGQITWQVGSLREVRNAIDWLPGQGVNVHRTGRDAPGSNWHVYVADPDEFTNELYYGIEQIGWDGFTKPKAMYGRTNVHETPALPQMAEADEVQEAMDRGVDLLGGHRHVERLPATWDVDGILLPRPFKVVRLGPVRLFVEDVSAAERFYRDTLGMSVTEEVQWHGQRCVFLRVNTEHHSVGLYPLALREELGLSDHTRTMALGLQLANYRQLRDAIAFLRSHGVRVDDAPPTELHPGIDYAANAFDPDGHCIQLYASMEQIGWDGRPRPVSLRRPVVAGVWPESIEGNSDAYAGEPFLGPWG